MVYEEPRKASVNWTQLFRFVQLPSHWSACANDQSLGTAEKVTQGTDIINAVPELSVWNQTFPQSCYVYQHLL